MGQCKYFIKEEKRQCPNEAISGVFCREHAEMAFAGNREDWGKSTEYRNEWPAGTTYGNAAASDPGGAAGERGGKK